MEAGLLGNQATAHLMDQSTDVERERRLKRRSIVMPRADAVGCDAMVGLFVAV